MVVGKGMIAKRFAGYEADNNVMIFASGVSNSKTATETEYTREYELLKKTIHDNPGMLVVYTGTCSVYDPGEQASRYVAHKLEMENYIRQHAEKYLICRASNVVGHTANTNTVLNYMVGHIKTGEHFFLWTHAYRNLLDIDDYYELVNYYIQHREYWNRTINIANPVSHNVREIANIAEETLGVKANCTLLDKGADFKIDLSEMQPVIDELGLDLPREDYIKDLLVKYFK